MYSNKLVTPERWTSSNKHFYICFDQFGAVPSDPISMPQPNKTKPPLQVLAVIKGNSEKIRFKIKHVMGE